MQTATRFLRQANLAMGKRGRPRNGRHWGHSPLLWGKSTSKSEEKARRGAMGPDGARMEKEGEKGRLGEFARRGLVRNDAQEEGVRMKFGKRGLLF